MTIFAEYWQAYEASEYFPRLYPYKEEFHDRAVGSGDGFDAEIHFHIPFFGRYYKSAFVSSRISFKVGIMLKTIISLIIIIQIF